MGQVAGVLNVKIYNDLQDALAEGKFTGMCACGCGQQTEVSTHTRRNRDGSLNQVQGYPKQFIKGHYPQSTKGEENPNWVGVRYKEGYRLLPAENHPRAVKGYVAEHILVMEEHIGRLLVYVGYNHSDNEVVHHENEVRDDNRIENLRLMTRGTHARLHRFGEAQDDTFPGFGCHAKGYGKLTRRQVVKIKSNDEGKSVSELANEFGVTTTAVRNHIKGSVRQPKR